MNGLYLQCERAGVLYLQCERAGVVEKSGRLVEMDVLCIGDQGF